MEPDEPNEHWLWRLDSIGWLHAALTELDNGQRYVDLRRTALTHARRAAGMALNALLVESFAQGRLDQPTCEKIWGRSYIDHLRIVGEGIDPALAHLPAELPKFASELLQTPLTASQQLVQVRLRHDSPAEHGVRLAAQIVEIAHNEVTRAATPAKP